MARWVIGGAIGAGLVAAGIAAVVAVTGDGETTPAPAARAGGYSNIYPEDYVGPQVCARCHPTQLAQWRDSLHRSMTQPATPESVIGDFAGARVVLAGAVARFERSGGEYVMSLARDGEPPRRFRVTRTIGTRYLQEYVGVATDDPAQTEVRLPFGWWVRGGGWFHQQYFDSWYGPEAEVDPVAVDDAPWDSRCAWCHNTYPFELRAVRSERAQLGQGTEQYVTLDSDAEVATRVPPEAFVTVGISCESCHLGGREHAHDDEDISFAPVADALRERPDAPDLTGGRANAVLINTVCAQCHSTPADRYPNGGVTRNSSEALDLAAGACMTAIKCTDCHDPHVRGPMAPAPDAPAQLAACTGCHDTLAADHSKHDAASASCLDCHMPRTVQGVGDVVRSHRISTPTERSMLAAAAPNACNLCHLDQPLGWTLRAIEDRWGAHIEPGPAWRLDEPMGQVWLRSGTRADRIAAAAAYARSRLGPTALPALIDGLDHPVAYDRMWTRFAVEDIVVRMVLQSAPASVTTIGK